MKHSEELVCFSVNKSPTAKAPQIPPLPSPLGEGAQVCLLEGESLVEVGVSESGGSDLSDESNFSKEKPTYQNS